MQPTENNLPIPAPQQAMVPPPTTLAPIRGRIHGLGQIPLQTIRPSQSLAIPIVQMPRPPSAEQPHTPVTVPSRMHFSPVVIPSIIGGELGKTSRHGDINGIRKCLSALPDGGSDPESDQKIAAFLSDDRIVITSYETGLMLLDLAFQKNRPLTVLTLLSKAFFAKGRLTEILDQYGSILNENISLPNFSDKGCYNALHIACESGNEELMQYLITKLGFCHDRQRYDGLTPADIIERCMPPGNYHGRPGKGHTMLRMLNFLKTYPTTAQVDGTATLPPVPHFTPSKGMMPMHMPPPPMQMPIATPIGSPLIGPMPQLNMDVGIVAHDVRMRMAALSRHTLPPPASQPLATSTTEIARPFVEAICKCLEELPDGDPDPMEDKRIVALVLSPGVVISYYPLGARLLRLAFEKNYPMTALAVCYKIHLQEDELASLFDEYGGILNENISLPNSSDGGCYNALHIVCEWGYEKLMKHLITKLGFCHDRQRYDGLAPVDIIKCCMPASTRGGAYAKKRAAMERMIAFLRTYPETVQGDGTVSLPPTLLLKPSEGTTPTQRRELPLQTTMPSIMPQPGVIMPQNTIPGINSLHAQMVMNTAPSMNTLTPTVTPIKPAVDTLVREASAPLSTIYHELPKEEKKWLAKTYRTFVNQLTRHWNQDFLQTNLRRLLAQGEGRRCFDLSQMQTAGGDVDQAAFNLLFGPFVDLLKGVKGEKSHYRSILAIILDVLRFSRLFTKNDLVTVAAVSQAIRPTGSNAPLLEAVSQLVASHLSEAPLSIPDFVPLNFIAHDQGHLLAFRDILFDYTLRELHTRAEHLEELLGAEGPTQDTEEGRAYFLFQKEGQFFLQPLTLWREAGTRSLLAVGRDTKGASGAFLQSLFGRKEASGQLFPIQPEEAEKLLTAYQEGGLSFHLFSPLLLQNRQNTQKGGAKISIPSSAIVRKERVGALPSQSKLTTTTNTSTRSIGGKSASSARPTPPAKKQKTDHIPSLASCVPHQKLPVEEPQPTEDMPDLFSPNIVIPQPIIVRAEVAPTVQPSGLHPLDAILADLGMHAQKKLAFLRESVHEMGDDGHLVEISQPLSSQLAKCAAQMSDELTYENSLLKEYQKNGVSWIWDLYRAGLGGVLASEPGLGKTFQALEFVRQVQKHDPLGRPILIVVPNSILAQWQEEIEKSQYSCRLHHYGESRPATAIGQLWIAELSRLAQEVAAQARASNQKEQRAIEKKMEATVARLQEVHELILNRILSDPCPIALALALFAAEAPSIPSSLFSLKKSQKAWIQTLLKKTSHDAFLAACDGLPERRFGPKKDALKNAPQKEEAFLRFMKDYAGMASYPESKKVYTQFLKGLFANAVPQEDMSVDPSLAHGDPYEPLIIFSSESKVGNQAITSLKKPDAAHSWKIVLTTVTSLYGGADGQSRHTFQELIRTLPFSTIIIDEAHELAWDVAKDAEGRGKKAVGAIFEQIKQLKEQHKTHTLLLSGTPFVNGYSEALSLLQLANPHLPIADSARLLHNQTAALESDIATVATNSDEAECPINQNLLSTFLAYEHMRARHEKLICVHTKADPAIQREWVAHDGASLIPERVEEPIICTLTDIQNKLLKAEVGSRQNYLFLLPKLERIFFHPALIDIRKGQAKTVVKQLFSSDIGRCISESGVLNRLFSGDELKGAVGEKSPVVFFVRQDVIGRALKHLLKKQFADMGCAFYSGAKSLAKRHRIVQGFENPDDPLKLLVVSQGAGGIGLNLKSAKTVIDMAPWWNEAVTTQAEARALRVGTRGVVRIHPVSCGTQYESDMQHIVRCKKAWKEYLFPTRADHTIDERLSLFVDAFARGMTRNEEAKSVITTTISNDYAPQDLLELPAFKTRLKRVTAIASEPRPVVEERIFKGNPTFQLVPFFHKTALDQVRAEQFACMLQSNASHQPFIKDLLARLEKLPQEAWCRIWNDLNKLLSRLDKSSQNALTKWCVLQKECEQQGAAPTLAPHNLEIYELVDGALQLVEQKKEGKAGFTVRLLRLVGPTGFTTFGMLFKK